MGSWERGSQWSLPWEPILLITWSGLINCKKRHFCCSCPLVMTKGGLGAEAAVAHSHVATTVVEAMNGQRRQVAVGLRKILLEPRKPEMLP